MSDDRYVSLQAEGGSSTPGSSSGYRRMLDDEDEPDEREVDGVDDILPPPPSKTSFFDKMSSGLCCLCSAGDIEGFRTHWAKRTILTDWFVTWLNAFVDYCQGKDEVKKEYLHFIPEREKATALYDKWCAQMKKRGFSIKKTVWRLTIRGMFKYGAQLALVEIFTMMAIYSIRLIIDYLQYGEGPVEYYAVWLFLGFYLTRILAILIRNYYDLHVYNFFRFVQTPIQAWIYEEVQRLRLWNWIGSADH